MSAPPTLSIIIVNWNTVDLLVACLASIRTAAPPSCEILVVDNASSDGSVERVRNSFPEAQLIELPSNAGFSRANNVALGMARGRYLLLLNPDTELRPKTVETMLDFLERHAVVGIVGPPLCNSDGSHQPSVQMFPSLGSEFLRQTMLHRVWGPERRESGLRQTRRVEVVTGAALCIRRECFDAIGPLDEALFMFYEDADWCRRAHDHGWEIWYVDGPCVVHHKGGASTGPSRTSTLLHSMRSAAYYFRKHHGAGSLLALRGIALLGSAARCLRAFSLMITGVRGADQRARIRAYARVARWAVTGGELQP